MEKVDVNEYWLFNPDGTPTAQTLAAFAESEASHGTRKQYATFDDLLADLDADD